MAGRIRLIGDLHNGPGNIALIGSFVPDNTILVEVRSLPSAEYVELPTVFGEGLGVGIGIASVRSAEDFGFPTVEMLRRIIEESILVAKGDPSSYLAPQIEPEAFTVRRAPRRSQYVEPAAVDAMVMAIVLTPIRRVSSPI